MSLEELEKYNSLKKKKITINSLVDIEKITTNFAETPTDFESFVAEIFELMGYHAEVSRKTNDGGFDIKLIKNHETTLVECKCYNFSHKVSRPAIQKLVGANQTEKAEKLLFVTTSDFSREAIEYAKATNVELINGTKLIDLVNQYMKPLSTADKVEEFEWKLTKEDICKNVPVDIIEYI